MSNERVKPLFEDASASPELRNFVAMARSDGPTQAELDNLTKRLAPVLGVSAGVAIAGQAAAVGSAPTAALSGASSLSGALPSAAGTGAAGAAAAGTGVAGAAAAGGAKAGLGAVAAKAGVLSQGSAVVKAGLLSQVFASTSAKLVALGVGVGVASVGAWELGRDETKAPVAAAPVVQTTAPARPLQEVRAPQPSQPTTPALAAEEPAVEAPAPVATPALPADARAQLRARRPSVRPVAQPMPPVAEPEPSVLPQPEPAPVIAAPTPPPALVEPPPPSELALIRQAQAARSNAGQALALLAQHQQQYPRGALAQEREVLAIEILLKSGLKVQAEARAHQFEASFGGSAHLPHLKALLERAGAQ